LASITQKKTFALILGLLALLQTALRKVKQACGKTNFFAANFFSQYAKPMRMSH
jgi:hypothetical protein